MRGATLSSVSAPVNQTRPPCARPGIALALWLASALALASCHVSSASQTAAERFMQLYYGDASAARAVELCTGQAEQRLRAEIKAIQGVAPDTGSERPPVTYTLLSHTDTTPTMRTYVYSVVPHTSDVGSLTATIELVESNGRWLVTSLSEQHSPP